METLLLVIITILSFATETHTKHVVGEIKTSERWVFLERFCFLSQDGTFHFDISYDMDFAVQKLLLYYDSDTQWKAVYKSDKTCEEREEVMVKGNNQIINLTQPSNHGMDCEVTRNPGENARYHCIGARSFDSARERWWFIAISNCQSSQGLSLNYTLTMTNGYSFWYKHFSADEFYILRTNLVALATQVGILFLSLLSAIELRNRQLLHTTYRLYLGAILFQISGIIFLILHYARYGQDGIGSPPSKLFGRILISASTIIMVLFLLLMAKGFTITRGRLRQASAIKLTIFMCLFSITYAALFIFEQSFFDSGEVLYIYESPAGYGLMVLRCTGWLMFLYACFFTVKHYPEKASFYYPFFSFYTLWFLSGPVIILISNHVIDKWAREKIVNGVEMGVALLGHLFFLFLTRPNAANKNFPYHVRTSQITTMEDSSNGRGPGGNLDAFNAHPYAVDLPSEPKNFTNTDLFIVSGSVELKPIKSILKEDKSFPHHKPGLQSSLFEDSDEEIDPRRISSAYVPS